MHIIEYREVVIKSICIYLYLLQVYKPGRITDVSLFQLTRAWNRLKKHIVCKIKQKPETQVTRNFDLPTFKNNCEECFDPRLVTLDPRPFTLDPRLVTLDPRPSTKRQTPIENTDSDLKEHVLYYANELLVRVRLSIQKLLQNRSTYRNNTKTMFGKRVMTCTGCR